MGTVNHAALSRMSKELQMLERDPPHGVWAAPKGDKITELEAEIQVWAIGLGAGDRGPSGDCPGAAPSSLFSAGPSWHPVRGRLLQADGRHPRQAGAATPPLCRRCIQCCCC
jgi:hypothetical protein